MNELQDLQQFTEQQRAEYLAHLTNPHNLPSPTYEEWLLAGFWETRAVLKECYDLLVEYDLVVEIEDAADGIDRRKPNPMRDEYARVVGVIEGVRVALGNSDVQRAVAEAQKGTAHADG